MLTLWITRGKDPSQQAHAKIMVASRLYVITEPSSVQATVMVIHKQRYRQTANLTVKSLVQQSLNLVTGSRAHLCISPARM